jgi:predicted RNA binding protein YcfA (HicA-like mRNA interferase family)
VLRNACGILFQTQLADFADNVMVVPYHPRRAQSVKELVKRLATIAHQHSDVSGSHVKHVQHVVQRCPTGM